MKLTTREKIILREIFRYNGSYSSYWTQKTNQKLESKGLVVIKGGLDNVVEATEAGNNWWFQQNVESEATTHECPKCGHKY